MPRAESYIIFYTLGNRFRFREDSQDYMRNGKVFCEIGGIVSVFTRNLMRGLETALKRI